MSRFIKQAPRGEIQFAAELRKLGWKGDYQQSDNANHFLDPHGSVIGLTIYNMSNGLISDWKNYLFTSEKA